jgi:hypothetical protein
MHVSFLVYNECFGLKWTSQCIVLALGHGNCEAC